MWRGSAIGILAGIGLFGCTGVEAQTIFVARHAERTGEPDPPLNDDGRRRAEALRRMLTDAGVHYFYTSDTLRAQQTAEPLAKQMGKRVEVTAQPDFEGLLAKIRRTADPERATLVIGHRATVPRIVKALGGADIAPLGPAEHDRLIVVTLLPGGRARAVTLRYGVE